MAAVPSSGTINNNVAGSVRMTTFPDIDIATTGDTFAATGFQQILNAFTNKPASVTAMTFSGSTVTFTTTGGAISDVKLTVFGY